MSMIQKTIALYARVSSDRQRQERTIESQLAKIAERIAEDGFRFQEAVSFVDDGYSGKYLQRPALDRLRDLAALRGIDRLYMYTPDRLARKYAYQVVLVEELTRNGVDVIFVTGSLGDSPEEALFLQLQGMFAEYERAKILERTRRGRRFAATRGDVSSFSHAPFGYRYISKQEAGQARFQVMLEEARVVRKMFEWVGCERVSLREVCRRFQRENVLSPRGNTTWSPSSLWHILRNPAYCGRAAYGKTRTIERQPRLRVRRGDPAVPRHWVSRESVPHDQWIEVPVPAVVSVELFHQVNDQLAEHAQRNREWKVGPKYLLQGLVVCGRCGYAYCGRVGIPNKHGTRYSYYRCQGSDKSRFAGELACKNRTIRLTELDEAVWLDVRQLLEDPAAVEREYARRLETPPEEDAQRRVRKQRMVSLERGLNRLIDAYAEGLIEKAQFEPRLRGLKEQLKVLQAEDATATDYERKHSELRLAMDHLQSFYDQIKTGLDQADWMTQRRIIRALISRIEIYEEEIRIVYRVNPLEISQTSQDTFSHDCSRQARACGG